MTDPLTAASGAADHLATPDRLAAPDHLRAEGRATASGDRPADAPLWALTVDARCADPEERDAFARAVADVPGIERCLVLATCHRVEVYGRRPDVLQVVRAAAPGVTPIVGDAAATHHLFRVAAGLESAVVGEDQVLSQIRAAARALAACTDRDAVVDRLAQSALAVGRRARRGGRPHEHDLAGRALRAVAAQLADRDARDPQRAGSDSSRDPGRPPRDADDRLRSDAGNSPRDADDRLRSASGPRGSGAASGQPIRLLVVGAGQMGTAVAMSASRRGMLVTVATRTPRRLFDALPVVDLLEGARLAPQVDAIVVALPVPWQALSSADPIGLPPVVDLSSPSAIPSAARNGLAGRFVGIDDLFAGETTAEQGDASAAAVRTARSATDARTERFAARAEEEVERAEREFATWLAARPAAAAAERLLDRAKARRERRVERTLRRLPELDERGRDLVRQLADQLAAELLHEPLAHLRADADGTARTAARDLFDL